MVLKYTTFGDISNQNAEKNYIFLPIICENYKKIKRSKQGFQIRFDLFFHSRETAQQVADLILWFMLISHVFIFFSVPFSTKYIPSHTGFLGNQLSKTEIDWVENRILQKFHFAMFNNEITQLPGAVVNFCNQNVWTFPL